MLTTPYRRLRPPIPKRCHADNADSYGQPPPVGTWPNTFLGSKCMLGSGHLTIAPERYVNQMPRNLVNQKRATYVVPPAATSAMSIRQ